MRSSRTNIGAGMLWGICVYLVLTGGVFVIVKQIAHITYAEIVGPYLAFAVPGVIFLLLVRWLWKWEAHGLSPMRLAFAWSLSIALFFLAVCSALFYSGVELKLVDPNDAVWVFGMMVVGGSVSAALIPYKMMLARISGRVKAPDNSRLQ
jgi:hypothetical protein